MAPDLVGPDETGLTHPAEVSALAAVEHGVAMTGESTTSIGNLLGLNPTQVGRRRRGITPWQNRDLCTIADHWGIDWCAMVLGPSAVAEQLDPSTVSRVTVRRPRPRGHVVDSVVRAAIGAIVTLTGETQTDLARIAGQHQSEINRRQRGTVLWQLAELGRLADHWGADICAMYGGPGALLDEVPWERIAELRAEHGMPDLTHPMPATATP